jgi:hypothetical protein
VVSIDNGEFPEIPEGALLIRSSRAANVVLIQQGEEFSVLVGGALATRTRVLSLASAEYDEAVEERTAPLRARRATERAAGAYAAMASENGAARTSRAQRGGKGGRGGV